MINTSQRVAKARGCCEAAQSPARSFAGAHNITDNATADTNSLILRACRNFVAEKEGFETSWVNYFPVYIRDYGSSASQSANLLSSDDAGAIPEYVR